MSHPQREMSPGFQPKIMLIQKEIFPGVVARAEPDGSILFVQVATGASFGFSKEGDVLHKPARDLIAEVPRFTRVNTSEEQVLVFYRQHLLTLLKWRIWQLTPPVEGHDHGVPC